MPPSLLFVLGLSTAAPVAGPAASSASLAELGVQLQSPEARRLRLDSAFDGSGSRGTAPTPFPELESVGQSLDIQNGAFRRFALVSPSGDWSVEAGQVGTAARNPLVSPSPYVGLRGGVERTGSVDASLSVQGDVLGLSARLYDGDAPALDAQVDSTIDAAQSLAQSQGYTDPTYFNDLRNDISVDTAPSRQNLLVSSALGQIGGVARNVGPVDLGVVAGALAKAVDAVPYGQADVSAAVRWRAPRGVSGALFWGIEAAPGLVSAGFWSRSFDDRSADIHLHLDAAAQAGAEAWGPLPGGSNFDAGFTLQRRPMTDWAEAHAATVLALRGVDLRFGGRYEQETGSGIGYAERKGEAELAAGRAGLEGYAGFGLESDEFGEVGLDNRSFMLGVRGRENDGGPKALSLRQVFGGQDELRLPPSTISTIIGEIQGLAALLDAVQAAEKGGGSGSAQAVLERYRRLSPWLRAEIKQEAGAAASSDDSLGEIVTLAASLVEPSVFERIVIRYMRHEILAALDAKPVPILGQEIRLTPAAVVALAGLYATGLAPVPPVTSADEDSLAGYLFGKLKSEVGLCKGSADEASYTECLLAQLPPAAAAQLQAQYGAQASRVLHDTLQWGASLFAQELDRELLEVSLAGRQALGELTVDGARSLAELDRSWLIKDLDRGRGPSGKASARLSSIAADLETDLREDEKLLRLKLTAYGVERASRLEGVSVDRKDWAPLLANYGDEALFDFIERARARLKGEALRVEYVPFSGVGVMVVEEPGSVTVRLPPAPEGAPSSAWLRAGLDSL